MSKKTVFIIVGVVVVLVAAGLVWMHWANQNNPAGASPYAEVSFTNGQTYFGKLSWSPSPHLTGVWSLAQNTNAQGQSQTSLVPFKNNVWGSVDAIYFNSNQVLFWTYLRNDSQLAKQLAQ